MAEKQKEMITKMMGMAGAMMNPEVAEVLKDTFENMGDIMPKTP